jgi:bifunctional non-homologous end joining protein LigD
MEKSKKMGKRKMRTLSSPEKVLYSKEKITKKDVGDYYLKVSRLILPHLEDRPLSLVRCPQGTEEKCFFQKHISGKIPASINPFPVKEKNEKEIYFSIATKEGLQELVQLNAFEIHTWNCRSHNIMNPDQIVMDFDPGPGVSWKEVIEGANELKKILLNLDLESFVKLTGGKGLHVHIPIKPIYSWDEVKLFAESLARELVSRKPTKYTANMSKKVRRGKIFVDYLRNGYGATAVAPYSLRAKPLSSVALPLRWDELKTVKSPSEFTLTKALRKIKARRKDPWEKMLRLKQEIKIFSNNRP